MRSNISVVPMTIVLAMTSSEFGTMCSQVRLIQIFLLSCEPIQEESLAIPVPVRLRGTGRLKGPGAFPNWSQA